MTRKRRAELMSCVAVGVSLLVACEPAGDARRPSLAIGVAPLALPGVTNACYRLTVTNAPDRGGDVVFQQEDVCADRYGDGSGSIAFVGPCDADSGLPNSVTRELLALDEGANPMAASDYVNPCGVLHWSSGATLVGEHAHGPCTIDTPCVENADSPRRSGQGACRRRRPPRGDDERPRPTRQAQRCAIGADRSGLPLRAHR